MLKIDEFWYPEFFSNNSLFIFSSSCLISFSKFSFNLIGGILCLAILVCALVCTAGLGVGSGVGLLSKYFIGNALFLHL